MQKYVVGFLFDTSLNVVLIEKIKPEWQAGRLNGIGGHVEEGEDDLEAMIREFKEEAGVIFKDWELVNILEDGFGLIPGQTYQLAVFKGFVEDVTGIGLNSCTKEIVEVYNLKDVLLGSQMLPSAQWLALMCLDNNLNGLKVTC